MERVIITKNKLMEILEFLETVTIDKIIISDHFIIRNTEEHLNKIYADTEIYKRLLTKEYPLEISIQPFDKVRIKYKHPYCDKYDFCIVFTREIKKIKLITTFNAPTRKRTGRC